MKKMQGVFQFRAEIPFSSLNEQLLKMAETFTSELKDMSGAIAKMQSEPDPFDQLDIKQPTLMRDSSVDPGSGMSRNESDTENINFMSAQASINSQSDIKDQSPIQDQRNNEEEKKGQIVNHKIKKYRALFSRYKNEDIYKILDNDEDSEIPDFSTVDFTNYQMIYIDAAFTANNATTKTLSDSLNKFKSLSAFYLSTQTRILLLKYRRR